jgi:uncharacterized membrane protein (UPF0127 family)
MNVLFSAILLAFASAQIHLQDIPLTVELADDALSQRRGLMGRTELADDSGMLFVYQKPQILSFWMKNTKIPLSIGFFDATRKLVHVEEMMITENESRIYRSKEPVLYALEVPAGWFKRHGIEPGTRFTWD